uniref:ribosomal RNA-processing protein 17 n=1 Tax=Erigeron canadensis TaxID=72917 RepID=UPI001CB8AAAD|nr:ribosomal RNA-processing protein 17 [Erigeron canadensis]
MEAEVEGDVVSAHHIKKRSLRNKALSVSFSEKDLSDYVTGFHKRKKKRRKEAQSQQQEALRRKRIELRKKRKLDREYVLYGGAAPDADGESNVNDEEAEKDDEEDDDDDDEHLTSVSGTKVYDTGNVKVMVTTSEISREDDSAELPKLPLGPEKKPIPQVIKKKPIKKVEKKRSRPKTLTKRDKRKGKNFEKRR